MSREALAASTRPTAAPTEWSGEKKGAASSEAPLLAF